MTTDTPARDPAVPLDLWAARVTYSEHSERSDDAAIYLRLENIACRAVQLALAVQAAAYAQLAADQRKDNSEASDWDDACLHIAETISRQTTPSDGAIYAAHSNALVVQMEACPFCGSTKVGVDRLYAASELSGVCEICEATGPEAATHAEAVAAWNARAALATYRQTTND